MSGVLALALERMALSRGTVPSTVPVGQPLASGTNGTPGTPGTVGTSGATTVALLENGDAGKKANEDVAAHVTVLSRQSKSEATSMASAPTSSPNSHRSVDDKSNLAFLHAGAPADDGACMAAFASKALDPLGDKHLPPREPVRRRRRRRIGWRFSPLRRFDGAPSAED